MKTVSIILGFLSILICYALTNPSREYPIKSQVENTNFIRKEIKIEAMDSKTFKPIAAEVKQQFIDNCRRYLGTPHQYGGVSQSGIDCSGLVFVNFQALGLHIPRNSSEQSDYFFPVDLAETQVGDILFFGSTENTISHTGIVTEVAGDNKISFIHTSTSKGVVEEDLTGEYWTTRLQSVGRPDYARAEIVG